MNKLTLNDCDHYLQYGPLTKPFIDSQHIREKVMIDFNHHTTSNPNHTQLDSLCKWIHKNIEYTNNDSLKREFKFQRTAQEIWTSGFSTGCTDYATVFATMARQIGIPTTLLHTAEYEWLTTLHNKKPQRIYKGHSFCECFYNNQWVLYDPTCLRIEENYNCKRITLSYRLSASNIYIPYYRGLDLEKKQTIEQHNQEMINQCLNINL